jgi:hypothetical protein
MQQLANHKLSSHDFYSYTDTTRKPTYVEWLGANWPSRTLSLF